MSDTHAPAPSTLHPLDSLRTGLLPYVGKSETADRLYESIPVLATPRGTMRAWFQNLDGQNVETAQVNRNGTRPWVPGFREVDASRTGAVRLAGSLRDYAGMRVIHSTPEVLIVADKLHAILYRANA